MWDFIRDRLARFERDARLHSGSSSTPAPSRISRKRRCSSWDVPGMGSNGRLSMGQDEWVKAGKSPSGASPRLSGRFSGLGHDLRMGLNGIKHWRRTGLLHMACEWRFDTSSIKPREIPLIATPGSRELRFEAAGRVV